MRPRCCLVSIEISAASGDHKYKSTLDRPHPGRNLLRFWRCPDSLWAKLQRVHGKRPADQAQEVSDWCTPC